MQGVLFKRQVEIFFFIDQLKTFLKISPWEGVSVDSGFFFFLNFCVPDFAHPSLAENFKKFLSGLTSVFKCQVVTEEGEFAWELKYQL